MSEQINAMFERDVAEHEMKVLRDDGVYRHIRFGKPDTGIASFHLVTWPMHLCYCGDMGTYVFSRLEDMFQFFRHPHPNFGYWAEKVEADGKNDGVMDFCREAFEEAVKEDFETFWESHGNGDDAAKADAWEDIEHDVINADVSTVESANRVAMEFEYDQKQVFPDFWEHRLEDFTHRFKWCCHALVWAIAMYDAEKAKVTP